MATFYDDFERANGALGGNWTGNQGSPLISGGTVVGTNFWAAVNTSVSDNHRSESIVKTTRPGNTIFTAGPTVRCGVGNLNGYSFAMTLQSGVYELRLRNSAAIGTGNLGVYVVPTVPLPYFTLRLVWEDGHLSAYYDGALVLEADDVTWVNSVYSGVSGYANNSPALDCTLIGGTAPGLVVTPTIIGNYGTASHMAATGVNTAWTPGTPGAPTLSVDHGTISANVVQDATHMTFDFDPGDYLGGVTFRDPTTGSTAIVMVSSHPGVVPPDYGAWPNSGWKQITNDTGTLHPTSLVLTDKTLVNVSGGLTIPAALDWIYIYIRGIYGDQDPDPNNVVLPTILSLLWQAINGANAPGAGPYIPATVTPVKIDTEQTLAKFWDGDLQRYVTTGDIFHAFDTLSAPDLSAVRADLGIEGQTAHESILSTLLELQGVGTFTLTDLAERLDAISNNGSYSLAAVVSAIAAISEPDLSAVTSKLALIQPSTAYNLTTLAAQAASLITSAVAIKSELDEVLALVEGIEIPAARGAVAPLWPGEANVTIGASQALSNGLVVDGPMHGVLLTITGHPAHNTRYLFGAVNSWARVGQIVFRSDRGDYERSQTFSMDAQIMIPATMEAAESATIRLNEGWTGTVRAWLKA